jgi:CRISPR-associated endonuclease/helicase Cas3
MNDSIDFSSAFRALTDHDPFPWQEELYERLLRNDMPSSCDIPTGLGKTAVIPIWLVALVSREGEDGAPTVPRRLVYVVNRRTVVDQSTDVVEKMRERLLDPKRAEWAQHKNILADLHDRLQHLAATDDLPLAISTLRGQFTDNREWSADPSRPAVILGTVDMIGSRLLFSGYRIGYKSKPLHAGFLGQNVLLIHDEAHLEPAFQKLIETIQKEQREAEQVGDLLWPKLRVMALSATTRNDAESGKSIFHLTEADREHDLVKRRIHAVKTLELHPCDDDNKELVRQLVDKALTHKESNLAVLLFARSVEHVESVARELKKSLKRDKLPESVATLTGTMRGYERDKLVSSNPVFARFLPKAEAAEGTVYLVCTSAGEVGVDISADHLVCDLSTFDSMAQRFGRVNRFGNRDDTLIDVVHPDAFGGKGTNAEVEAQREKTLELLKKLEGDAGPAALGELDSEARVAAFAPEPTILPATDILFDAWSLTTIRSEMPGRPPVEPYLHGVAKWELPRTQIAWREEVGRITKKLIERNGNEFPQALLDDYPLKPHELLSDRSDRVLKHLGEIAKRDPESPAWLVSENGTVEVLSLEELADKDKKARINGQTILLPPEVGGLNGGLLDGKSEQADDVVSELFDEENQQRRAQVWDATEPPGGMALIRTIDTNPDADEFGSTEDETENRVSAKRFWHWYARPRDAEDAPRNSATPITLEHHTGDVVKRTQEIVDNLGLPDELKQALVLAAKYHDLGKRREVWQRSIGNPNPTDWHAKSGRDTVTKMRWKGPNCCPHYRHEFGSLLDALDPEQEHLAELEPDMQDLVLHLIAAHHGLARPHIPTDKVYDPTPGSDAHAQEQALDTPCRFARLQRKYGRWGLAYIESLLRAADWAASAEPSPPENNVEEDNS